MLTIRRRISTRFCWFAIVLTLLLTNKIAAQSSAETAQKIASVYPLLDSLFRNYGERNHFPGFVYGLVVNGKLVHTASMGYTDVEKKIPVSPESGFRIASMTKSFTAMAIVRLRDEGKLKLDDPVQLYIPEMMAQRMPAKDAEAVTIRHLLTHSAGFPEDNPWGDRQLEISELEMLNMFRKGISFSNVPGVAYEYSNMGYAMLGYIIKKVSGLSYEAYINENIFKPLRMQNTKWDYADVSPEKLAHGYRRLNGNWVEQPMLKAGAYGAMGGLITSMNDFAAYVSLHQSAWPPSNGAESGPLRRSSLREMHHPWNIPVMNASYKYPSGRPCATIRSYGYGLRYTKDCQGRVNVGHSGGLPGFGSEWHFLPDYDIGIISFSNLTYGSAGSFNAMMIDTLIAVAKLQPIPKKISLILEQRKNELIKLLPAWSDAAATGIFAENFFLDYFPDSLRKEATAIFAEAGKIISIGKMKPENDLRGSFILEGAMKNIEVYFTLTPENPALIQEYGIRLVGN